MPQEVKDTHRALSRREKERAIAFEKTCSQMEEKGYVKKELTVSIKEANLSGLLLVLPDLVCLLLLFIVFTPENHLHLTSDQIMLLPIVLLVLIVVHELIHGFVWGLCLDRKFDGIEFGVIWKLLTPYCTCTKPLGQKAYVIGSIMPTLLLGHLPAVYAVFTGNLFLFLIGMVMITGGAGDKLIQDRIRKSGERHALCLDHPYECGVVLFVKQ